MKNKFVLLILSVFNLSLSAQSTEKEFLFTQYEYTKMKYICETENGNFIAALDYRIPNINFKYDYYGTDLILIDKNFEVIRKNKIFEEALSSDGGRNVNLLKVSSNLFFVSGFKNNLEDIKPTIKSYLIDDKLNFIDSIVVDVKTNAPYKSTYIVGSSEEVNGQRRIYLNHWGIKDSVTILTLKIDIAKNKFEKIILSETNTCPIYHSYICPYENKVKYSRCGTIADEKGYSHLSNNKKAVQNIRQIFKVKDSTYVLGFSMTNNDNYPSKGFGCCIAKIDEFLNIKNFYSMYDQYSYTTSFGLTVGDLAYDKESFFISDLDHFSFRVRYFFNIHKVDLDLKKKWSVGISLGRQYDPMTVNSLKDGGVIVCGNSPDSYISQIDGNFIRFNKAFLVRLDKDGNFKNSVGINEDDIQYIKSYPNPTNGLFKIETNDKNVDQVKVFNLEGKELFCHKLDGPNSTIELDLSSLQPSLYIYNLYDNAGKLLGTNKVVKE
jgi:hypothetical protein